MSDIVGRQRTVPVRKNVELKWRRPVSDRLQRGAVFVAVSDAKTTDYTATVTIDDFGFFLRWKAEGGRGRIIETTHIQEVRMPSSSTLQQVAKDSKLGIEPSELLARCFEIVSGEQLVAVRNTVFVAPDAEIARAWADGVRALVGNRKAWHAPLEARRKKYYYRLIFHCSVTGNIPIRRIAKLFGGSGNVKAVLAALGEINSAEFGTLSGRDELDPRAFTFDTFEQLVARLAPRTDIEELFRKLTNVRNGTAWLTADRLAQFINSEQRDARLNEILYPRATRISAASVIERFETSADNSKLSLDGFVRYLESEENAPIRPEALEVDEDTLNEPLAHYFISSSHNTYLTGRQFGGRSSVEMYRQVLLAGCRCIEIDAWDGKGDDQEPVVTHGKAMTSEVPLRDVLVAIRDTAFTVTDYPVIISVENHLCNEQQYKFARYCEDVFGELLLSKPLDSHPIKPAQPLPPPSALRRRILIKNKRLKPEDEKVQLEAFLGGATAPDSNANTTNAVNANNNATLLDNALMSVSVTSASSSHENDNDIDEQGGTANKQRPSQTIPDANGKNGNGNGPETASAVVANATSAEIHSRRSKAASVAAGKEAQTVSPEEDSQTPGATPYVPSTANVHPYLSAMVNYCHAVKFASFEQSEQTNMHCHMSSFNELAGLSLLKTSVVEFVNYNKRQLSRIYPKGNRVDSSNYLPQIFWNAGCQMVALNYQTGDLGYQLNHAKFEYNGACGYMLKPECMRRTDRQLDPFSATSVDGLVAARFTVQVLSAFFLSASGRNSGCYVEVELYGLPADTIRKECRTRIVTNCVNPIFNEEPFVFRKIILPELALVRFAALDETGRLLGQRVIPFDLLQAGYRHIALRNEFDLPLPLATLFVRLELSTYVPDSLAHLVDVLSDPLAFRSVVEKRVEAMRSMGIDELDLVDENAVKPNSNVRTADNDKDGNAVSSPGTTSSGGLLRENSVPLTGALNVKKKDDASLALPQLSIADVQRARDYVKLIGRQAKEIDALRKAHRKAAGVPTDSPSPPTDQQTASPKHDKHDRSLTPKKAPLKKRNSLNRLLSCASAQNADSNSTDEPVSAPGPADALPAGPITDDSVTAFGANRSPEVSDKNAVVRTSSTELGYTVCDTIVVSQQLEQLHEEWRLRTTHIDTVSQLVHDVIVPDLTRTQLRDLEERQTAEQKQLKADQTRQSMESTRAVQLDKQINKAERDRRIREATQSNTKRFIDERKRQALTHSQQTDRVRKLHADLEQDMRARFDAEGARLKSNYEEMRTRLEARLAKS